MFRPVPQSVARARHRGELGDADFPGGGRRIVHLPHQIRSTKKKEVPYSAINTLFSTRCLCRILLAEVHRTFEEITHRISTAGTHHTHGAAPAPRMQIRHDTWEHGFQTSPPRSGEAHDNESRQRKPTPPFHRTKGRPAKPRSGPVSPHQTVHQAALSLHSLIHARSPRKGGFLDRRTATPAAPESRRW